MSFKYTPPAVAVKSLLVACAFTGAVQPVLAADEADASELIEVLGTRIKRVDRESASPVISIGREEIAKKGYANVSDVLGSLSQTSGGEQQVIGAGYTSSASAIDLRALGVGRSLILLDGRRLPQFPGAFGGTDNFIDLSMIPAVAVERIDILSDGASAIYGSDAMSGVINIVLRKDIEGHNFAVRGGMTEQGGGAEKRLQYAGGFGDETTRATAFVEIYKRDALKAADRERSRSNELSPGVGGFELGGNNFLGVDGNGEVVPGQITPSQSCDPARGFRAGKDETGQPACGFDIAYRDELQSPLERFSVQGGVSHQLSDSTELFARAAYVRSTVDNAWYDTQFISDPIAATAANNPTRDSATPVDGIFTRYLSEFNPSKHSETDSLNLVAGLDGQFDNGLDWQTALSYGEQRTEGTLNDFINRPSIQNAVNNGSLNLLNPLDAPTRDALRADAGISGKSSLLGADFQVSGDAFQMPAGPALFAAIIEANHQQYSEEGSDSLKNGEVINAGLVGANGERDYAAIGGELLLPLHETLNLNIAGRYDHYMDDSSVGGAFSPKLALEYRPIDELLLRASVGRSFRAPDMQSLFGGNNSYFASAVIDTSACAEDGGTPRDKVTPACNGMGTVGVARANIDLEEEKGQNYNIGAVWQPLEGLSMSVDLWRMQLTDKVAEPHTQDIMNNPQLFADQFTENATTKTPGNPRGIVFNTRPINLAEQTVSGVDAQIGYDWEMAEFGSFKAELSGSYMAEYKVRSFDGQPLIDALDGRFGRTNGEANAQASLGWERNEWQATLFADYIGGYVYGFAPEDAENLGSFTKLSLNAGYKLPWDASVSVGVNNLLDREPPLLELNNSSPFTDTFRHDLVGRSFYAEYSQRF